MGNENFFFAEKELCNGRMNDRLVDRARARREPRGWAAARPALQSEESVVVRRGVAARVTQQRARNEDALEAMSAVAGGAEHLRGLTDEQAQPPASAADPRAPRPPMRATRPWPRAS